MLKKKLFKPFAASLLSFSLLAGSFAPIAADQSLQTVEAAAPKTATKVTVNEVVDGDTIKVTYKGKKETVRLILIDTPETKDPKKCVQLFGPEASDFTKKSLLNKEVKLELGIQTRDKYGRILAYIYLNDVMFNKTLLEKGLARVAIFPPNTQYLEELQAAEAKAKKAKLGIWSSTNAINGGCAPKPAPAPVKPAPKPKPAPAPKPAPKPTTPPKKESFKNCTELRKKYPDGVKKGHPAYDSKHDRDKDGWACER
ncbi:thermonuclease family protein [Domibacillus tundrae]|uniref:thermonuclease family protein n=1 Tax=Domibacillus tundrae TaxID=1587527 RepID=UPI000617E173|nr:thermonuclease family protein [Domibacillus tundrae]